MDEKIKRLKYLTSLLSDASRAYYQESRELMSNLEYDALYDELLTLEKETGISLSGSPTSQVGYEVLSELPKERHEKPMLSLDKTKNVQELCDWLSDQVGLLSWKMDGLTIVLTYEGGRLSKAVTRGNGEVGEVVTANARTFINLPSSIPFKGRLILRGEAVISYSDFERLNAEMPEAEARYKNPRNLCSGSVRQLSSLVTASRNVRFIAFSLVEAQDKDFDNSRDEQLKWLSSLGFDVVEYERVTSSGLPAAVKGFSERIKDNDIPSDGLVILYDDIGYGTSLGRTAKFPRDSMAFKWADETKETTLSRIEWSASRTGLINPIAVFESVELEGTTVSRASLHNVSIMEELELGPGDTITVYKANMIIPQIAENLTRSGGMNIPSVCPVCGGKTAVRSENGVRTLRCTNPGCQAKKLKRFSLFVSRDALNIDGLSEMTLEKLIAAGLIHEPADIFRLGDSKEKIVSMEGFGKKSFEKLVNAAEKASHTSLYKLIYGLGITGIGLANAKLICRHFGNNLEAMRAASSGELCTIDGIGEVLADAWTDYFSDDNNNRELDDLLDILTIENEQSSSASPILSGKTFVITGSLENFKNRRELQARIEALGGKVAGSVSSKTSYLVNNDLASSSSKNKKARELGIPIIPESEMLDMLNGSQT